MAAAAAAAVPGADIFSPPFFFLVLTGCVKIYPNKRNGMKTVRVSRWRVHPRGFNLNQMIFSFE